MLPVAALLLATASSDAFATRLWKAMPHDAGNVVVSPTSLNACLGLLIQGVGPGSRAPLAKAFGIAPGELDAYDAALQERLRALTEGDETTVSNAALFAHPPAPAYAAAVEKGYGAKVGPLGSVESVNRWVSEHTKGRIPQLVERLSSATEAVLLNAVTFDGTWAKAFSADATRKEPFAAPSGSRSVDTMHLSTGRFGYAQGAGFRLVALPYQGGRYRMVVMLSDAGDPGRLLGDSAWRRALAGAQETAIDLALPRFTLRGTPKVETAIKAMGLAPLFATIDLRPAVPSGAVGRISEVVQKTFVQVDEKGTKAAAATGIIMKRAVMARPTPPVAFHVDRPFAFVIQHVASGEALFEGFVREP